MSEKNQEIEEAAKEALEKERYEALQQLEDFLETPVLILGFVWLVLLFIELLRGSNPLLEAFVVVIWVIFLIDFALRFMLAPKKIKYLKSNWLTALSLMVPALRLFRVTRVVRLLRLTRTARSLRLFRLVSSINRGMRALRSSMGRRGFGYVTLLTLVVTLLGAAGMFYFESAPEDVGLNTYGEALWWTAMLLTSIGSEFWPRTAEGRVLTFLLSMYAFGIFGYVTAALASFFIGQEADSEQAELPSARSITALQAEIVSLRSEIHAMLEER